MLMDIYTRGLLNYPQSLTGKKKPVRTFFDLIMGKTGSTIFELTKKLHSWTYSYTSTTLVINNNIKLTLSLYAGQSNSRTSITKALNNSTISFPIITHKYSASLSHRSNWDVRAKRSSKITPSLSPVFHSAGVPEFYSDRKKGETRIEALRKKTIPLGSENQTFSLAELLHWECASWFIALWHPIWPGFDFTTGRSYWFCICA